MSQFVCYPFTFLSFTPKLQHHLNLLLLCLTFFANTLLCGYSSHHSSSCRQIQRTHPVLILLDTSAAFVTIEPIHSPRLPCHNTFFIALLPPFWGIPSVCASCLPLPFFFFLTFDIPWDSILGIPFHFSLQSNLIDPCGWIFYPPSVVFLISSFCEISIWTLLLSLSFHLQSCISYTRTLSLHFILPP